ncbi:MAG: TIGR02453 family protein [Acidobacteriota bacterium]
MSAYFSPALFAFLKALKRHNDREWFEANRERYVSDVEAPILRFISELAPRLAAISPAFVVDPRRSGGSMYRIYRDTRFSSDKSPYKTHVAATFPHIERKKAPSVPGFYLHLEPGDCMGGGGIYHPDTPTLTRIRLAITENRKGWAAVKKTGGSGD